MSSSTRSGLWLGIVLNVKYTSTLSSKLVNGLYSLPWHLPNSCEYQARKHACPGVAQESPSGGVKETVAEGASATDAGAPEKRKKNSVESRSSPSARRLKRNLKPRQEQSPLATVSKNVPSPQKMLVRPKKKQIRYSTMDLTPPWANFHGRYLHSWNSVNSVGAKKVGDGTSRRELSEDVPFGIGTLLAVEQSSLENRPRGG